MDEVSYKHYSPLFLSTTFAFSYALSFGSLTAVLVHTALFHWRQILDKYRSASDGERDIHLRLYSKYPEVPDWWYLILFGIMMLLSIFVCVVWDTRLPWWGFLVTQLIPFLFTLPCGMVLAVTNVQIGSSDSHQIYHRIKRHYRVCCGIYVSWSPSCEYDDQNLWLYDDGASNAFLRLSLIIRDWHSSRT